MFKNKRLTPILVVLICLVCIVSVLAQQQDEYNAKPLPILSRSLSPLSKLDQAREEPLLNSDGEIVGSVQRIGSGADRRLLITPATGVTFSAEEREGVMIAKSGNRVITFGDPVGRHAIKTLSVTVYSADGNLITSVETDVWVPYVLTVADNGDFWIAGKKGYEGQQFILRRYSSSGELLWERDVPRSAPMRLVLSPDNSNAAVVFFDDVQGSRTVFYYDQDGNLLHRQVLPKFFFGVEFVSDQQVVVYCGDSWEVHQLGKVDGPVSSGKLKGTPIGKHPVTGYPDGSEFAIVTLGDKESGEGYRLQIFDTETGRLLAEDLFEGSPLWQPYPFTRVTAKGTIELLIDQEIIELQISE